MQDSTSEDYVVIRPTLSLRGRAVEAKEIYHNRGNSRLVRGQECTAGNRIADFGRSAAVVGILVWRQLLVFLLVAGYLKRGSFRPFRNFPFHPVASSAELERHITILNSTNGKKLLLVVDNEPAYIGLALLILGSDYEILSATNGVNALRLVESSPMPDLILLDVSMPDLDGIEVCRSLKASPKTREIPVIFLTGQTNEEDETRGFEAGAVDYIHKPFCPAVVKARVQTHIMLCEARKQLSRQLASINNELEMAREIQLSILPDGTPRLEGLDIAARYSPMSAVAGTSMTSFVSMKSILAC